MYGSIYGRSAGAYSLPSRNTMFSGPQRGFAAGRSANAAVSTPAPTKEENACGDAQNACAASAVRPMVPRPWPAPGARSFGPPKFSSACAPQKPASPFCPKVGYLTSVFNAPSWPIPAGNYPGVVPFNLVTDASLPGVFDTLNSVFVAPCKGLYHFDFVVEINATSKGVFFLTLSINNIARVPIVHTSVAADGANSTMGYWQGVLEAGDVVALNALTTGGDGSFVQGSAVPDVLPYPTSFSAWWFTL